MSELLFECYGVPGISYGVDALFSYHNSIEGNLNLSQSGLVISLGYQTIHIIPIIDGQVDIAHARRINIGGFHVTSYMHRLLQLKYPVHFNAISLSRSEVCKLIFDLLLELYFPYLLKLDLFQELVHDYSFVPAEYKSVLKQWGEPDYYDKNVVRIQLPYTVATTVSTLSVEQQKERRKELAKRLVEINARKRDERVRRFVN